LKISFENNNENLKKYNVFLNPCRFRKIVREFGMEKLNNNDTRRRLVAFEAYDVLSDPFWRELYDQFGERAIKLGVFVNNELRLKRYSYHGDIFSTYK